MKDASKLYNCPNCGAPIESDKCPYCGTTFIDFATIDLDDICYVRFKYHGKVLMARVRVPEFTLTASPECGPSYRDMIGQLHRGLCINHQEIDLHMYVLGGVEVVET